MAPTELTDQQQKSATSTGQSVLVSAGAGSGKTAVIAERCANLLGSVKPEDRCGVDELLVLTFTDASAAEMRGRIVAAIRERLADRPHERRLEQQLALIDTAQISTIHAFCLWMTRRWFSELAVDPTATLLDAEEAKLLQRDTLEQLFEELYHVPGKTDPWNVPRGKDGVAKRQEGKADLRNPTESDDPAHTPDEDTLPARFAQLVDTYGLGDDTSVAGFVLKLYVFSRSLPVPQQWLDEAARSLQESPDATVTTVFRELVRELDCQIQHGEQLTADVASLDAVASPYAEHIRNYVDQLRQWRGVLKDNDRNDDASVSRRSDSFDAVQQAIGGFKFARAPSVRLADDANQNQHEARDAGKRVLKTVRESLFQGRLCKRFGLFSWKEWREGVQQTAPFVATLAELVERFATRYHEHKCRLALLDFSDLQQYALQLLADDPCGDRPSNIARQLQRRFKHVLVDEFQDINPIQHAIIRLVSRETSSDEPNNLFVVGDVKQSIYRFRLAEPDIFLKRYEDFRQDRQKGAAFTLTTNFRSREEILETINLLFGKLTALQLSHFNYDRDHALAPGRKTSPASSSVVEMHLLPRRLQRPEMEPTNTDSTAGQRADPAHWSVAEREAYVIGTRIQDMVTPADDGRETFAYGDCVVLLRAARVTAERMANMLSARGIPAHAEVGGSLFTTREVRDVLAALHLADNAQQDIPMAAVLRNGIFGLAFDENDLVEIRCLQPRTPFHACVHAYAERGPHPPLRQRVETWLRRLARLREEATRRPLADVLWRLYNDHSFLAYTAGLPNGRQRQANLLKLHEFARKFGSFRTQGLHRFLRFVESLAKDDQGIAQAAVGTAEGAVRIMSIHKSKGLEFPVVFLAGLGTKFNLGDRTGRMIFGRRARIGLRVVDTQRMIEYASAAHDCVAREVEQTTREEEMRILYVAMTRARERLIMVGTTDRTANGSSSASYHHRPPPPFEIETAQTPLDWILPILHPSGRGRIDAPSAGQNMDVYQYDESDILGWTAGQPDEPSRRKLWRAVANWSSLPTGESLSPQDNAVEQVLSRIEEVYPYLSSAAVPAAVSASQVAQPPDHRQPEDAFPAESPLPIDEEWLSGSSRDPADRTEAAQRGVATHTLLQHLDFAVARDSTGVSSELDRILQRGWLDATDRSLIDIESVAWFVTTPLAERMRAAGDQYRREFSFTTKEPTDVVDPSAVAAPGDFVLVRGIVDGILPDGGGLEIVDFKTDDIGPNDVDQRANRYNAQLTMYARAMARIWKRPVVRCHLIFLTPRQIVSTKA